MQDSLMKSRFKKLAETERPKAFYSPACKQHTECTCRKQDGLCPGPVIYITSQKEESEEQCFPTLALLKFWTNNSLVGWGC